MENKENRIKLLLFNSGGIRWGIDLDVVRVISNKAQANKSTNRRKRGARKFPYAGSDIPLISLKKRLRIAANEANDGEEEIIVLKAGDKLLGLTVEAIEDVVDLSLGENIFPLPPLIRKNKAPNWVWGIAKLDNQLILLLEPEYDLKK